MGPGFDNSYNNKRIWLDRWVVQRILTSIFDGIIHFNFVESVHKIIIFWINIFQAIFSRTMYRFKGGSATKKQTLLFTHSINRFYVSVTFDTHFARIVETSCIRPFNMSNSKLLRCTCINHFMTICICIELFNFFLNKKLLLFFIENQMHNSLITHFHMWANMSGRIWK